MIEPWYEKLKSFVWRRWWKAADGSLSEEFWNYWRLRL